jgi:WD40 repeat protein
MVSLGRRVVGLGSTIAVAIVAIGCGMSHAGVESEAKKAASPCGTVGAPAWSTDGTHVAWFGYRWPLPPNHHATGSYNTLRAFCVSNADGKHLHQLPRTVCSERCANDLGDPPDQLNWVGANFLVYGSDDGIHTVSIGQKPKLVARKGPDPYSIDATGDRVATGVSAGCSNCAGPVTIRSVPSGAVVGLVGGATFFNGEPSLSPDGKRVAFARRPANDSGPPGTAIWTASANGSNPRRLEREGEDPLWSPAGNEIVYATLSGPWRLVSPQGGASKTLLRTAPGTVFGWSPDGRWIAYPDSRNRLAVVNVPTRKVRKLLRLGGTYEASSVAWSPDSQQLLVVGRPPAASKCPTGLWRVPIDGTKPHLVHSC